MRHILPLILVLITNVSSGQPNCSGTSVGYPPINDLGTGTWNGWTGGLYPGGSNYRPAAHQTAGLAFAAQVQPLDTNGNPDPVNGKIVWISIGFSNNTQETQAFIPMVNALSNKNPKLVVVDGAQGGQTATILSTPSDPAYSPYWNTTVKNRLAAAGVTAKQVQAIWFKDDNQAGSTPIDTHSDTLLVQSKRIMNELKARFPNANLCYVASRIYAGYASTGLNPEPYAYRNGWTMKKLIEAQINGDPQLNHSGAGANSPWISWGVYLWADGTTPRSDGLTWLCSDYSNDGTHPGTAGRQKVAGLMLDFFKTDSTTCPWFLNGCTLSAGTGEKEKQDFPITISPNPFRGDGTIRLGKKLVNTSIVIFNARGQNVHSVENFSGEEIKPESFHLADGLYFIQVTSSTGNKGAGKFVVAR